MSQTLAINNVQLLNFGRSPKKGAYAHFSAPVLQAVNDNEVALTAALGCSPEFPEYMPGCTIDGDFQLHSFELVPNNRGLSQYQLSGTKAIQAGRLHEFQVVRRELPGKQGKGFRFEWRFTLRFADPEGCYKMEQLMNGIGAEKSRMMVGFTKQAVQQTLLDHPEDGTRVEITADPEAQRRILEGVAEGDLSPQVEGPGQTHAERVTDIKQHKARARAAAAGKENVN